MEKSKLLNFISKYHLGKLIQSVAWNVNGGLSTRFISDDKCVVGEVKLKSFQGDDWKFGVYNTDLLVSLLGVLGNIVYQLASCALSCLAHILASIVQQYDGLLLGAP